MGTCGGRGQEEDVDPQLQLGGSTSLPFRARDQGWMLLPAQPFCWPAAHASTCCSLPRRLPFLVFGRCPPVPCRTCGTKPWWLYSVSAVRASARVKSFAITGEMTCRSAGVNGWPLRFLRVVGRAQPGGYIACRQAGTSAAAKQAGAVHVRCLRHCALRAAGCSSLQPSCKHSTRGFS